VDDSVRGQRAANGDRHPAPVEEDDVDREAHAEGVDAATARDQEAVRRPLRPQEGEAEESRQSCRRDGEEAAGDPGAPETPEADRWTPGGHAPDNPGKLEGAPHRLGCNRSPTHGVLRTPPPAISKDERTWGKPDAK